MNSIVFIILAAVLSIAGILIREHYAQKRRRELRQYARSRDWQYSEMDRWDILHLFKNLPIFQQGNSQKVYNVMSGKTAVEDHSLTFRIFDYSYTIQSGDSEDTFYYTLCLFEVPYIFRPLSLRLEERLDKLAGALGFQDIQFESREFNDKFYIKSPDKKFAYDIISATMMKFLLAFFEDDVLEMGRGFFCLYRNKPGLLQTPEMNRYLAMGKKFIDRIPEHAKRQYATSREGFQETEEGHSPSDPFEKFAEKKRKEQEIEKDSSSKDDSSGPADLSALD